MQPSPVVELDMAGAFAKGHLPMTHEQSVATLAVTGLPNLSSAMIIPAAPDASAVVVTCAVNTDLPQSRDVNATFPAVIGWRFADGSEGAAPVFAFDPCGVAAGHRVMEIFLQDDGAGSFLRDRDGNTVNTLAEAKDQVLHRARQLWNEGQRLTAYLDAVARLRPAMPALELVAA